MTSRKNDTTFDQLAEQAERVKSAVADLVAEHDQANAEIARLQLGREALLAAPVPPEDLKAFVVEFIDARADGYVGVLRAAVEAFAHPLRSGVVAAGPDVHPLTFAELEHLASASDLPLLQVVPNGHPQPMNAAVYYFFRDAIKAGLQRALDGFDLPYRKCSPEQIGSDRATRRAQLAEIDAQLVQLSQHKAQIETRIVALGGRLPPAPVTKLRSAAPLSGEERQEWLRDQYRRVALGSDSAEIERQRAIAQSLRLHQEG